MDDVVEALRTQKRERAQTHQHIVVVPLTAAVCLFLGEYIERNVKAEANSLYVFTYMASLEDPGYDFLVSVKINNKE